MAAPKYALATYQALLAHGYSSVQAIGIMANMWHESGINPESDAMDSNGYPSVGLVSFNTAPGNFPNARSMVTGNPTADINKQVAYLATIAGPKSQAAAGSTGSQVAGNWAANFERCVGCQPGGSQYSARSAFASTVAGWVSAGHWTVSSGTGSAGGSATGSGTGGGGFPAGSSSGTGTGSDGSAATTADTSGDTCLLSFPLVGCVMPKTLARQVLGGLVIAGAFIIVLVGADLLFKSAGLGGSGGGMGKAARTTGEMLALFPPAEGAGVALSAAGGHINRTSQRRAQGRTAATAERRAATGSARATTYQHRADTERSRRRSESRARQYNAQTARSSARAGARAAQYNAQTARQREERLGRTRPRSKTT